MRFVIFILFLDFKLSGPQLDTVLQISGDTNALFSLQIRSPYTTIIVNTLARLKCICYCNCFHLLIFLKQVVLNLKFLNVLSELTD